ncbi:CoA-dependent acyltransferase, partial [Calocera cornea HHB12733]
MPRPPHRGVHTARPAPPEPPSDATLPPMHRYQPFLPALPVPPLEHTVPLYLSSIAPHCTPAQLAAAQRDARAFLASPLAAQLQDRLLARAAAEDAKGRSVQAAVDGVGGNWLADWWNSWAYNSVRDPVVPWVSYYYVHKDPDTPTPPERRAAELVRGAMAFRELVDTGALAPDKTRETPLDMSSFKYLFNSTRYPEPDEDWTKKFPPAPNGHVVLVRGNRFWKLAADGKAGGDGDLTLLRRAIAKIYRASGPDSSGPAVGALTSAPRDLWARARPALLAASPSGLNKRALHAIDTAVIVLALDAARPVTREEIGWACWAGDGRGRWFDKHQFIVFDNGRSGFLGEHSAMDGTPTLRLNEFVLAARAAGRFDDGTSTSDGTRASTSTSTSDGTSPAAGTAAPAGPEPEPEELIFELNDEVRGMIAQSEKMFDEVMQKHDMHV